MDNNELMNAFKEARTLKIFKKLCDKNVSAKDQNRLRSIYSHTIDQLATTKNIIRNELGYDIDHQQAQRLTELIKAFLIKSPFRKQISVQEKRQMLIAQNYKCAICGETIDLEAHADHIVPFKYVGDQLADNYQMLCSTCNLKKNASIDYQIRYYLEQQ